MNLVFTPDSWDEYLDWVALDKKTANRINKLFKDIMRSPFGGIGKPEPLQGNLSGFWSRRIDDKYRLVYQVLDDECQIIQCKGHYSDK